MEPTQTAINYTIFATVKGLKEVPGLGWFIIMSGSQEWLGLGQEKPTIKEGERVKITIGPVPW